MAVEAVASAANPALAWINAGSGLLNAVGGLKPQNAQPGISTSGNAPIFNTSEQDFSGFTVATSGAKANGATIDKVSSNSGGLPSALSDLGNLNPALVIGLAIGAAVLWRMLKS